MKELSIIIPAYNEEDGIANAIESNLKVLSEFDLDFELIVVNDGSKDRTQSIIESFSHKDLRWFKKENGGFGSAIRTGISHCTKENIVFVAVDSPFTNEVFQSVYDHIGVADIAVGYRIERKGYSARMRFNSKMFHFLVSRLFGIKIRDYNWMHLYKADIFVNGIQIEYNGIFMLAEVLIKAKRKSCSIVEFPVEMIKRSGGVATAGSWSVAVATAVDLFSFYFRTGKS